MGDEGSIRDIHELFNVNVICTHAYGHISSVRSALPHHSYLNVLTMGGGGGCSTAAAMRGQGEGGGCSKTKFKYQ